MATTVITNKTHIVIHHSLTSDGDTVSWDAIKKYHMEENGWRDIGYHFGVERVGSGYSVLLGRMPDEDGAHCKEAKMNSRGIGVCLVGNFDIAAPPAGQWEKALKLCYWLVRAYSIPYQHVIGHREGQAMGGLLPGARKSCPGTKFDMDRFRGDLFEMA